MDILHRRVQDPGASIYFIISSNENPYYFIQCHGIVRNVIFYEDFFIYNIKLLDVLESSDMLLSIVSDTPSFRVFQQGRKFNRVFNKKFFPYNINNNNIKQKFIDTFNKYFFEVPSMFTFESYEECRDNLISVNSELISILNSRIEFLVKRNYI